MQNNVATYLTRPEAAKHLHISTRLLDRKRAEGCLPFIRISRKKILFDRQDLDDFMSARRVDASGSRKGRN